MRNMPCKALPAAVQLAADVKHTGAEPGQRAQHCRKLLPGAVQQLRVRDDERSRAALVEPRLPHRRQRIARADEVGSCECLGCLRG